MKKTVRILALTLCVCLLTLSLCACKDLDTMRKNRATWQGGDILFDGATYQLLPACENLMPQYGDGAVITVSDAEVPLLLSGMTGSGFYSSEDGVFLIAAEESDKSIYCRADKYQSMVNRIKGEKTYTLFGYAYTRFDENAVDDDYYVNEEYMLTATEALAVQDVLTHISPLDIDPQTMDDCFITELYAFTEDKLFYAYVGDIYRTEKCFYVVVQDRLGKSLVSAVPDAYTKVFDNFTKSAQSERFSES